MLKVNDLTKSFVDDAGPLEVIRGASLEIGRGEMVALVGVSGSGKTTLLQILGGLDKPSSGSVVIDGKDLATMRPAELALFRNKALGFVFQFHHLLPDFTAFENTMLPGLIGGKTREQCGGRARELLDSMGLTRRMSHYPSELSGGERQRVALARAMFNRPALVLADEPTGNLDKENTSLLVELFHQANRDQHQTFLVATHNDRIAEGLHRKLRLEDGRIQESERTGTHDSV